MASIKDAMDEVTQEKGFVVKFIIFALPIFGCIYAFKAEPKMMTLFYTCLVPSIIVILGTMTRVANNVMNFRETTLPTWNVFTLLFDTIRMSFAILPAVCINGGIAWALVTKVYPMIAVEAVQKGAIYITYAVCASIVLTVFMLYAKRFRISDPFDIMAISNSCIDVLIQLIWLGIQLVFVNGIIFGSITYLFWMFLGLDNWLMWYVWAIGGVYNTALIGNYLGQLNHEALHQAEDKKAQKQIKEEQKQTQKEVEKIDVHDPRYWNR